MGEPTNGPTDAEQAEAQAAIQAGAEMLVNFLGVFARHLPPEDVQKIATAVIGQQPALGQVIQDCVDPAAVDNAPAWGVRIHDRRGGIRSAGEPEAAVIRVPKDPQQCKNMTEFVQFAQTLAFVTTPLARAFLAAHGFQVEFLQFKGKPKVVLS